MKLLGRYRARRWTVGLLGVGLLACGEARRLSPEPSIETASRQLIPAIERAVGLKFKRPPVIAARSREQVRAYLRHKLDADLPPAELEGLTIAYRLLELIPDTVDLRSLLLALYTEQVVGYYDPDSSTLYVVRGTDPAQLRLVLAHELVHALQGQYLDLDSLLEQPRQNDRRMAAQAVMEGQATLAALAALMPEQDFDSLPDFWRAFRKSVRNQQARMPVFAAAPRIVREDLIFPYLAGADFVRWFVRTYRDTVPFGRRLPVSTEQVLHPDRYQAGDAPLSLAFHAAEPPAYEDGLGEFETRVLLEELTDSETVAAAGAAGWAGDRYAVFAAAGDYALVWFTLWDSDEAAGRFYRLLAAQWPRRERPGRRGVVRRSSVAGRPAVELVDAPQGWSGWENPPAVSIR